MTGKLEGRADMTTVKLKKADGCIQGYGSFACNADKLDNVSAEYVAHQNRSHREKVHTFLLPLFNKRRIDTILDVGCGVGIMAKTLSDLGYEVYGADLTSSVESWIQNDLPKDRFFVVDPINFKLPFEDNALDLVYSFGAIEHVGTTNGHSDRREDYHEIRRKWLLEIFRVVRPGGHIIVGGPNRSFPLDTHGPDSKASKTELCLYKKLKISVHKTWGEHFLWSYKDFDNYLKDVQCEIEGLSIKNYYKDYRHVPKILRPLFRFYVEFLPKSLLKTGFNPWALVSIQKNNG